MSFSVVTNNGALAALYTLNQTNQAMNKVQSQINSGLKVQNAADDASTFTIAQTMRGDIQSFKSISNALALGDGTVNVALQAATTVSDTLIKIKGKIADAQGENVNRVAIQNDINNLLQSITTTVGAAQFNGVNLLDGTRKGLGDDLQVLASMNRADASSAPDAVNITVAAQDISTAGLNIDGVNVSNKTAELKFGATVTWAVGKTMTVTMNGDATDTPATETKKFEFVAADTDPLADAANIAVKYDATKSLGENLAVLVDKMAEHGITASYNDNGNLELSSKYGMQADVASDLVGFTSGTMSTGGNPAAQLDVINDAISLVNSALDALGTSANQITTQKNFVGNLMNTMTSAVGQLVDADMAAASAELQSLQTRQQLGIQALSIANQQPGSVLSLFR